jgi:anti-sigma B factor antagonist
LLDPQHAVDGQAFRCLVVPDRETGWVCPTGELDLATVGRVDEALRELREDGFDRLVLDLRGLTFVDSTGVRLVLLWVQAAEREGFDLAVARGSGVVMRIFELSGLNHSLPWAEEAVG